MRHLAYMAAKASALPVHAPLSVFRYLGEASEMMTRLGVAAYKKKKGFSPDEMIRGVRQGTIDFRRVGKDMKNLNALIPFLNARIQGIDRLAKTLAKQPDAKNFAWMAARLAISAIGPAMALMAWNTEGDRKRKYGQIPSWEKDAYWIIMLPDGNSYLKVAKSHIAQVIVNPAQMVYENANHTAAMSGWEIGSKILMAGLPVDDATGAIPHALKILIEQPMNKDAYFGRPIVTDEALAPANQYDQTTYETLKTIGAALDISPQRMQHILRSLTGGSGATVLYTLDQVLGRTGVQPLKQTDPGYAPFVKRVYGQVQEWKSDLAYKQRNLIRELKDAKAALNGMMKREGRAHMRDGNLDAYQEQMSEAAKRQVEHIKGIMAELEAVNKAMGVLSESEKR